MGPPDNSLQAQTISSCVELLSCDPCCENVQGLPNPVHCSRSVLHLVDFISRNALVQNVLLQLLPGKSSRWGLSAWGWLSENFVGELWSLIHDNGCSWRKTLLKSDVSVTGEGKVSVLVEGLNVVIMYSAVQSCLHVYNKIPCVFWKKIQRKYITAALKNHNAKWSFVYLGCEGMPFDTAAVLVFNRLGRICLSPTWFTSRWLLLIASRTWTSWDSLSTASAAARKPTNYSAKKPWKVSVPLWRGKVHCHSSSINRLDCSERNDSYWSKSCLLR